MCACVWRNRRLSSDTSDGSPENVMKSEEQDNRRRICWRGLTSSSIITSRPPERYTRTCCHIQSAPFVLVGIKASTFPETHRDDRQAKWEGVIQDTQSSSSLFLWDREHERLFGLLVDFWKGVSCCDHHTFTSRTFWNYCLSVSGSVHQSLEWRRVWLGWQMIFRTSSSAAFLPHRPS